MKANGMQKKKLTGNGFLLLITIALFVVMYVAGMIVFADKGFAKPQMFLNLFVSNAGLLVIACGLTIVVAIGARSVEDQQHRLTASGVGIPVGMKNPTGGDLSVMMNSITAAQGQHVFLYRGWEVQSLGNPYAHALLRGYVDKHGKTYSNYHYEDLNELFELYQEHELKNPGVIIDTNHANSGKHYLEQIRIAKEVLHSCRLSKDIKGLVKGLMIESYIEDGNQPIGGGCYGKSITDPCLGWEKSERLIYEIADLL